MAEASDAQKFATWLGIVVSVIGVLAFFGITNFDDLRNAGAPDRSDACSMAIDARHANKIIGEASRAEVRAEMHEYAQRLLEASSLTDDKELRSSLRESSYGYQDYGDSLPVTDASRTKAAFYRASAAEDKWQSLCGDDDL
ncbi:hypothetical protein O7599_20090 [Streptomyces sp. WMMC500]|uniref:hypothetical protein n=1 Tax=Streptomyces sp. WMMC500 TaxID=3015154 RepID=UPI00248B1838|nr:hypothetical protein [Streptomyces sp. WMMC500]WBB57968.1 hypothetical protein O7599_20090 [Streptomyces sp. WMMC500]